MLDCPTSIAHFALKITTCMQSHTGNHPLRRPTFLQSISPSHRGPAPTTDSPDYLPCELNQTKQAPQLDANTDRTQSHPL